MADDGEYSDGFEESHDETRSKPEQQPDSVKSAGYGSDAFEVSDDSASGSSPGRTSAPASASASAYGSASFSGNQSAASGDDEYSDDDEHDSSKSEPQPETGKSTGYGSDAFELSEHSASASVSASRSASASGSALLKSTRNSDSASASASEYGSSSFSIDRSASAGTAKAPATATDDDDDYDSDGDSGRETAEESHGHRAGDVESTAADTTGAAAPRSILTKTGQTVAASAKGGKTAKVAAAKRRPTSAPPRRSNESGVTVSGSGIAKGISFGSNGHHQRHRHRPCSAREQRRADAARARRLPRASGTVHGQYQNQGVHAALHKPTTQDQIQSVQRLARPPSHRMRIGQHEAGAPLHTAQYTSRGARPASAPTDPRQQADSPRMKSQIQVQAKQERHTQQLAFGQRPSSATFRADCLPRMTPRPRVQAIVDMCLKRVGQGVLIPSPPQAPPEVRARERERRRISARARAARDRGREPAVVVTTDTDEMVPLAAAAAAAAGQQVPRRSMSCWAASSRKTTRRVSATELMDRLYAPLKREQSDRIVARAMRCAKGQGHSGGGGAGGSAAALVYADAEESNPGKAADAVRRRRAGGHGARFAQGRTWATKGGWVSRWPLDITNVAECWGCHRHRDAVRARPASARAPRARPSAVSGAGFQRETAASRQRAAQRPVPVPDTDDLMAMTQQTFFG